MRPTASGTRHRPGAFKMSNKGHKGGRHKSNRGLKRLAGGGRVSKATQLPPAKLAAAAVSAKTVRLRRLSKADQRNRAKMMRQAQLAKSMGQTVEQLMEARKLPGAVAAVAPTLVTFVWAEAGTSVSLFQAMLRAAQACRKLGDFQFRYARPACGSVAALVECLDLAKVSDALVLVFQAGAEFSEAFRRALSALYAQGLPGQLHAIVLTSADSQKDRRAWEKAMLADLEGQGFGLPADCGLMAVRGSEELAGLLRRIASRRAAVSTAATSSKARLGGKGVPKGYPAFAKARCYGLVEKVTVQSSADSSSLRLVTHIRGSGQVGLNTGDLIHLVGWGDYRLTEWSQELAADDGDQDVPLDQDPAAAEIEPFGVAMETAEDAEIEDAEENEEERDPTDAEARRVKQSELDFPDEVDTPKDVPARERFKRYRHLASLQAGSWDPWADLPEAYSSLVYFSNFLHARNRAAKAAKAADYKLRVGQRVAMHLSPVAKDASASSPSGRLPLLVWYRMLEHEDKLSVVNCSVRLNAERRLPIRGGGANQLVWQVGWRRFVAAAVFSECDTPATAAGAPRLCLRHLGPGSRAVASFYAPLTFTPASALALCEAADASRRTRLPLLPLMSGCVDSCDPGRVVLKRAILSGQPFKIHKRSAVIRYLFFNPEDAGHYRDAKLRTKHGRRGQILEPVGTHGLCKCRFDGPVTNMDTVLLDLYRRQFPKMTYRADVSFAA